MTDSSIGTGMNATMREMWHQAEERFQARTNRRLDVKPAKTLKEVMADLEERRRPAAADNPSDIVSATDTAKKRGMQVLQCLQVLGGIAAKGAEMVFQPSALCFNAVSLLLRIPETLHSFHEEINSMFEIIGSWLSMSKIYGSIDFDDGIGPELKEDINRLMVSFVDICSLFIQLSHAGKRDKLKTSAKLFFLQDDSGVKEEMEKFNNLLKIHSSVQGTETLKIGTETKKLVVDLALETKIIRDGVEDLKEAEEKRKTEATFQAKLRDIELKLGLEGNVALQDSKSLCHKLWHETALPKTTRWFESDGHEGFRKWARGHKTNAVYLLTGEPNTGKSVVMSSIFHYLHELHRVRQESRKQTKHPQTPRALIAGYFFPNSPGKTGDSLAVNTALKCIAVQFAEADPAFCKRLWEECQPQGAERTLKDASCKQLWKFLGIGDPTASAGHYILIDGLSDDRNLSQLFDALKNIPPTNSTVKVLVSVRTGLRDQVNRFNPRSPRIQVENHNKQDIELYIVHLMDTFNILHDPKNTLHKALREKIQDQLSANVHGNYYKAKTTLEKIKTIIKASGSEVDIDTALDEARQNAKVISQGVIDKLEDSLQAAQIRELNELLIWVTFGMVFFNIQQLNAALFLHLKSLSVIPLEEKLASEYANLFDVWSSDSITKVGLAEGMQNLLTRNRTASRTQNEDNTPKFSATIKIEKADLSLVQTFVWRFMQQTVQEQWAFEKLAQQASIKGRIRVNEFDSHLALVQRTFELLDHAPDKRTQPIAPYLLRYLPGHLAALQKATGHDAVTEAQRQEIGRRLLFLFVSGEIIEQHWDSCDELKWYGDRSELSVFLEWLKDPLVVNQLGWLDREWLQKVIHDHDPCCALLMKIMKTVAIKWLAAQDCSVEQPFKWLKGFVSMSKDAPQNCSHDSASSTDQEDESSSVKGVADWCKRNLGVEGSPRLWHERLAETFHANSQYQKAIESYKIAAEHMEQGFPDLKLAEGMAKSLAKAGMLAEACEEMQEALLKLGNTTPEEETSFCRGCLLVAKWHAQLGQRDEAIRYLRDALRIRPADHHARFQLFKEFLHTGNTREVKDMLSENAEASALQKDPGAFEDIVDQMADDGHGEKVFERLFTIAKDSKDAGICELILDKIDRAINRAHDDRRQTRRKTVLLLYKGIGLHHYGFNRKAQEDCSSIDCVMDCWKECAELKIDGNIARFADVLMSERHFELARTSEEREAHFKQLKEIVEKYSWHFGLSPHKAYLASYFTSINDTAGARSTLQESMNAAFDILTDGTYDNDGIGYYDLAYILMHCGDMPNALSAFYLLAPESTNNNIIGWMLGFDMELESGFKREIFEALQATSPASLQENFEKYEQNFQANSSERAVETRQDFGSIRTRLSEFSNAKKIPNLVLSCDGCSKNWGFVNSMNVCKFCYDKAFCDTCLEHLKAGRLHLKTLSIHVLVCNAAHEWLHLDKWDKETYLQILRGNVLSGGTFEGGRRVGGQALPISSWLDGLKEEWGFAGTRASK